MTSSRMRLPRSRPRSRPRLQRRRYKKKRIKSELSDTEEDTREKYDTIGTQPEKKEDKPVKIVKYDGFKPEGYEPKPKSITLASIERREKAALLSTKLTEEEQQQLKLKIKNKKEEIKKHVDKLYPDDYKRSTLISDDLTKEKNQIVRKIKFAKMKEIRLKEFIRKEKDNILTKRRQSMAERQSFNLSG